MINLGDLLIALKFKDEMTPELRNTIEQIKELNSATAAVKKRIADLEGVSQSAAYKFTLLGRGMREAGMITTGLFTTPLIAAGKATIDFGAGFEREMTKVITLAGSSAQFIDQLKDRTLSLSAETGIAAEDLAKGLFVIESYGFEAAKTFDILTTAAKLSALGMGTTEQTALGLTGALFAFREQGIDSAEAANVLIKAVRLGNMEIQELIPAMATVNPLAASLGVSMQDTAASIATFTHAGVNARVASTGLRAMLSNILQNSRETERGFRELASATGDSSISMENFRKDIQERGLTQAMISLAESVEKTGIAGMEAFDKIFPNIRGLVNALAVYRLNGEQVLDIHNKMIASDNTLADSLVELEKTWEQQWKRMQREIENLWISLSEELLPVMKASLSFIKGEFLPVVQGVIETFKNMPTGAQAATFGILGFLAVLGPGTMVVGFFVEALGNLSRGLGLLMVGNAAMGPKAVAAFLMNPYVLGGAAVVTALGAAFLYLSNSMAVNTEATVQMGNKVIANLNNLNSLEFQLNDTNEEMKNYNYITREILSISPQAADAIAKMGSSYEGLTEAIKGAKEEQKELLRQIDLSLQAQIAQLEEQRRFKTILKEDFERSLAENPNSIFSGTNRRRFIELSGEISELNARIAQNRAESEKLKLVYNDAHRESQQFWNGVKEAAERAAAAQAASGDQIEAQKRRILAEVENLTEAQREQINTLHEAKLTAAQISEQTGIAADVVGVYTRQLNEATAALGRRERAEEQLLANTQTNLTATQRLWEEYEQTMAQIAGESLEAKFAALDQWYGKEMAAIQRMEREGVDVADRLDALNAARSAKHAQLLLEQENTEKRIASELEQIWDQYYAAVAQAEGDSLEAKLAAIDRWYNRQYEAIQTAAATERLEWQKLAAVVETYWARRRAVISQNAEAEQNALNQIYSSIQRVASDTESLWEQHKTAMSDITGNSVDSQIAQVQAQAIKARAINQKSLDDILHDIRTNRAISFAEEVKAANEAIRVAQEKNEAITAIEKARIKAIKEAQKTLDFKAIVEGFESVADAFGGLTGEVISGVAGMIDAFRSWETQSLTAAQKVGVALQGVANIMRATSNREGGQWLTGGIEGAKAGMQVAGPVGAAVGFGVGAITGLVQGATDGRRAIEDFVEETFGSFEALREEMNDLGAAGEEMWIALTQGVGQGDGKGAQKAIEEFEQRLAELNAAVEKYGLTWRDVEDPAQQLRMAHQEAATLTKTFNDLVLAGYSAEAVIGRMGDDINEWIGHALRAGIQIPASMEPIIRTLIETGGLTEENARLMLGYGETAKPTLAELEAAAGRYGMKLEQLGPAVQQMKMTETANQIVKDFEMMIAAGVPFELIMQTIITETTDANGEITEATAGMRQSIQDLVDEARNTGRLLPESMRPILERMLEAGLLTDDFGNQLLSLDDINFEVPLTAKIDELIEKLGELVDRIGDVGEGLGGLEMPDVPDGKGKGKGGKNAIPNAYGGDYLVTKPTLFLAGEGGAERATFTPLTRDGFKADGGGITIHVHPSPGMNEAMLAEKVAQRIPGLLKNRGR